MSTINQVTGKRYRILKDATNKIWDEVSFRSVAADCYGADGQSLESKVGAIKGLVTEEQSNSGYVLDASVAAVAPKVFSITLRNGGETTVTITDSVITDTAKIAIYTNEWGFMPINSVVSNHTLTVEFPEPDDMVLVKIEVGEFHS